MKKGKVIIVNKEDVPIGLKAREEIDPTKDIYRITAIWVTNKKGEVLIAQRKFTKKINPGKWGPAVAGTLEEGETYESNAYKELEEEIGIAGVVLKPGPKIFVEAPRKYFAQWYTCVIDKPIEDFVTQEDEVEQVRWISVAELKKDVEQNLADYYVASMPLIIKMFTENQTN